MADIDATALETLDRTSREEWSIAASEALIQSFPGSVIITIAAAGFDAFLKRAKPIWDVHGFRFEDYRRAFDRINLAAERLKAGKGLGRLHKRLPRARRH